MTVSKRHINSRAFRHFTLTQSAMYSTEIVRTPHDDGSGQNDYILENEKKRLRQHLGLSPEPGGPSDPPKFQPLFFIEMAPNSPRGAKCKLSICGNNIWPRELRLALNPAMGFGQRYRSSAGESQMTNAAYFVFQNMTIMPHV